jgi:multiple antibiotic resistance protein
MDPFGNLPVFMSTLERVSPERRRFILVRELLIALVIIIVTVLCGSHVVRFMGLQQESVSIAGSIILFIIALRMVFPGGGQQGEQEIEGEPLLVPLAVPLVAGPSLLAVLLLFTATGQVNLHGLLLAACVAWSATFIVLLTSTFLMKYLTRRGLVAVEKLMGMVLVALSVQLFLDGARSVML